MQKSMINYRFLKRKLKIIKYGYRALELLINSRNLELNKPKSIAFLQRISVGQKLNAKTEKE